MVNLHFQIPQIVDKNEFSLGAVTSLKKCVTRVTSSDRLVFYHLFVIDF